MPCPDSVARRRRLSNPILSSRTPSALDRFVLAFRRDCLNAAPHDLNDCARLYWDDRGRFYEALSAAWGARRPGAFIPLCRIADLNEDLGAKAAQRLACLLVWCGRGREAIEVLEDPRFGLLEVANGYLWLALAHLALGQPERAREAIAEALAMDESLRSEAEEMSTAIADLIAARAAARISRGWTQARRLIDECLVHGAGEAAGDALRAFVVAGELRQDELADFHAALDTVLSLTPPDDGVNLFRGMERFYLDEDRRADLRLIADVLSQADDPAEAPGWRSAGRDLRTSGALAWARAGKLKSAILGLGQLSMDFPRDSAIRAGLARAISQDVLSSRPLRLERRSGPRKIFDVFLFHDELRMLELKLNEMHEWVDHFVLVEARQTFTGASKPLVFQENRDQFAAFAGKIVHVVVDQFPAHVRHPWSREFHQRDAGILGLAGRCSEEDLVIISDADEITARAAVESFSGDYARLAMERARFFLNYREALRPEAQREAGSVWRAGYLPSLGLSYARIVVRGDKRAPRLTNSGWHFTSINDVEGLTSKVRNASHQEHAGLPQSHFADIIDRLRRGELDPGWERCELDERFPDYIRRHREELADLLL